MSYTGLAGSDYPDQGVGYLKESPSGPLIFSKDTQKQDRKLRIQVMTKDQLSSSCCTRRDYTDKGLSEVEIELWKARDALFDEELYHEVLLILPLAVADLQSLRRKLE